MAGENSKFKNSSFHREGRKNTVNTTNGVRMDYTPKIEPKDSEFIHELVETGRPNWKKAPTELRKRYNGIFLILIAIPLIVVPSIEFYKRLEGKSTKKVRQGELLDNKEVRIYNETEKWQEEKESWVYKIFGKDFFLDGFTSKTMKRDKHEANDKNN
ncbi:uncharacterized protein RJT21DRAFT_8833 [Scheffersomyces amazonensis]|uniref:uncharacterized protein n=1 Tax=Scheffersomyces amazonensis TaxID=1078765 RepID=UPI00315CBB0A